MVKTTLPLTVAMTAIDYDAMKQVISQTLPSSNTITQTYTHGAMASRSLSGTQLMAMAYTQAGALSARLDLRGELEMEPWRKTR